MKKILILTLLSFLLLVYVACSGKNKDESISLLVVSSARGEQQEKLFDNAIIKDFEAAHPGVKITWDSSAGDDYQFLGLIKFLESNNPPDIYFEWGGSRVGLRNRDGYAEDVSDIVNAIPNKLDSAFNTFKIDGNYYGVAEDAAITNMFWYEPAFFEKNNLSAPKTWDEFLSLLQKIKDLGITPITIGNSDLWPLGSLGSHLFYRVAGDQETINILTLKEGTSLMDSGFVKTIEYLMQLKPFINNDINSLGYEESASSIADGSTAIYPMGSWFIGDLIPLYQELSEGKTYDYFNLPEIKDGKGDQTSVLSVSGGFMINKESQHKELAKQFLAYVTTEKYQRMNFDIGSLPTIAGLDGNLKDDDIAKKLISSLSQTETTVAALDIAFNLEVSDAMYKAMAMAVDSNNKLSAKEILEIAEKSVDHLR